MSEKSVRLCIVGRGDPELQEMIEHGLNEVGCPVIKSTVAVNDTGVLDTLSEDELPIVIKPA